MQEDASKLAESLKRKAAKQGNLDGLNLRPYDELSWEEQQLVPSPATGKPGSLTPPREFNMMFETHVGALRDGSSKCYLRPETAQGIFANFKNIVDTGASKFPLGLHKSEKLFATRLLQETSSFALGNSNKWKLNILYPGDEHWPRFHGNGLMPESNGSNQLALHPIC